MEMVDIILVNKVDGDLCVIVICIVVDYVGVLWLLCKCFVDLLGFLKVMLVLVVMGDGLE